MKWIDMDDEFPKDRERVLFYCQTDDGSCFICHGFVLTEQRLIKLGYVTPIHLGVKEYPSVKFYYNTLCYDQIQGYFIADKPLEADVLYWARILNPFEERGGE